MTQGDCDYFIVEVSGADILNKKFWEVLFESCTLEKGSPMKSRPGRRSNWIRIEEYLRSSTHDCRFSGYKDVVCREVVAGRRC